MLQNFQTKCGASPPPFRCSLITEKSSLLSIWLRRLYSGATCISKCEIYSFQSYNDVRWRCPYSPCPYVEKCWKKEHYWGVIQHRRWSIKETILPVSLRNSLFQIIIIKFSNKIISKKFHSEIDFLNTKCTRKKHLKIYNNFIAVQLNTKWRIHSESTKNLMV